MSIIVGERVRLRAVEREDVKMFHEWVNDPEVTRGLGLYLPMSMADEENWFEAMTKRDQKKNRLRLKFAKEGTGS